MEARKGERLEIQQRRAGEVAGFFGEGVGGAGGVERETQGFKLIH